MTVTSLSFTLVNTCAPQGAKLATAVERKTPLLQHDDTGHENKRPASRQNRLADAMMSALRELGFGSTAAAAPPVATTTTTPAPTDAASAADGSARVESAVQQFAHALFQVLRQGGGGNKGADDDAGRVAGHGEERHHHRRDGEGQGYGDLSQRLEALSQTVGAPAASSATPVATAIAAPAATPAKNALLDAFTKLFDTLQPATTGTAASSPANAMAEKLRQFLHTLAQALAPDKMGSVQHAQVGSMVNVTA